MRHWSDLAMLRPERTFGASNGGWAYDADHPSPSVRVPLADFFADGCGGRAAHFTTPFVEKAPESYNCFIPMPFESSARVVLRLD